MSSVQLPYRKEENFNPGMNSDNERTHNIPVVAQESVFQHPVGEKSFKSPEVKVPETYQKTTVNPSNQSDTSNQQNTTIFDKELIELSLKEITYGMHKKPNQSEYWYAVLAQWLQKRKNKRK